MLLPNIRYLVSGDDYYMKVMFIQVWQAGQYLFWLLILIYCGSFLELMKALVT
jgi:hypothetical protein